MGGATEDDNAMIWFLERSNGGDILVLRTSGSNGYNDYLYNELGVDVNSVETIVLNNSSAANESYIHNKVLNAEAIWFAGGDQSNLVQYSSEVQKLKNAKIKRAKELYNQGYQKSEIMRMIIEEFKLERDPKSRSWSKWLSEIE